MGVFTPRPRSSPTLRHRSSGLSVAAAASPLSGDCLPTPTPARIAQVGGPHSPARPSAHPRPNRVDHVVAVRREGDRRYCGDTGPRVKEEIGSIVPPPMPPLSVVVVAQGNAAPRGATGGRGCGAQERPRWFGNCKGLAGPAAPSKGRVQTGLNARSAAHPNRHLAQRLGRHHCLTSSTREVLWLVQPVHGTRA